MSSKGWLALILLLPAVAFERMGYYAARSVMMVHLIDGGTPMAVAAKLMALVTAVSYLVSLLGGGLAFAIGPRPTAAIGALIAAIGMTVLAVGAAPALGVMLVSVGAGVFRPCPVAAAAEIVAAEDVGPSGEALGNSPRRFAMVGAFAVAMYGAVNLGSLVAPVIGGALRTARGFGAVFGLGAALYVLALVLVGAAALVGLGKTTPTAGPPNDVYRTQAPAPLPQGQPVKAPNAIAGVALLAVPMLFYGVATSLSYAYHRGPELTGALLAINPVVVIVTSVGLAGLWIAAAIGRWTLPPLRIWGIGFAVFGLGLLPLAVGVREDGSIAMFAVGSLITAVGETAIAPMAMTYAALAARPRAAALLLAGLSLVSWMASSGGSGMAGSPAQTPVLIVMGVVSLLIGIVAGSLAPAIHRKLFAA